MSRVWVGCSAPIGADVALGLDGFVVVQRSAWLAEKAGLEDLKRQQDEAKKELERVRTPLADCNGHDAAAIAMLSSAHAFAIVCTDTKTSVSS